MAAINSVIEQAREGTSQSAQAAAMLSAKAEEPHQFVGRLRVAGADG